MLERAMATLDDNWQTKRSTISERTKFIFNNELLSDVKFVAPASYNERKSRKSQKCIPARKFILAISSPVFYVMFYGEMVETSDTIQLPDCDYESLLELFRFLYSNKVNLSGSNVMQVLYLAKKYLVPSLADRCTEYLQEHLEASNVFPVLPQAQKFEDKDLEERCWEVIEAQTENALTSKEFVTLKRFVVKSVVKRERLSVKEVDLFKAVNCWATKEVERQGLNPDGVVKRNILGEEIVKAIRFPVMTQEEPVASFVLDCDILTKKEIGFMMKHYVGVGLESSLPFMHSPGQCRTGLLRRVYRFAMHSGTFRNGWNYVRVKLQRVQRFGSEGGTYKVSLEVKEAKSGFALVKQTGTYSSEKEETNVYSTSFPGSLFYPSVGRVGENPGKEVDVYYGFDVMFDPQFVLSRVKRMKLHLSSRAHHLGG